VKIYSFVSGPGKGIAEANLNTFHSFATREYAEKVRNEFIAQGEPVTDIAESEED
jgi:hypothetical protein